MMTDQEKKDVYKLIRLACGIMAPKPLLPFPKTEKTVRDMSRSVLSIGTPYDYVGLDDKTFAKTLAGFVEQGKKQAEELGSTLFYRILPGRWTPPVKEPLFSAGVTQRRQQRYGVWNECCVLHPS